MNSDGTNIENLTNDDFENYSPDWSPDGKWIAYTSGTSKQYDVWLINLKTKQKLDLPQNQNVMRHQSGVRKFVD